MKNYDIKFQYLMRRQLGQCPIIAGKAWQPPAELHHAACHNTKHARAKFPLFIDSVWNLIAVSKWGHDKKRSYGIHSHEYVARRERFLERHPKIARWVNCPDHTLYGHEQ